jgi:hypothetical protein
MDQIDPRNHFIHQPIEGEHLSRANRPCPVHPNTFMRAVRDFAAFVAIAGMITLGWFVLCAFQMEMPV